MLQQLSKAAAFGSLLAPRVEVSFETAMFEPVSTAKGIEKILRWVIQVNLIAAEKLDMRPRGGRQVHVGSTDVTIRIFASKETRAEHGDERRIGWTR